MRNFSNVKIALLVFSVFFSTASVSATNQSTNSQPLMDRNQFAIGAGISLNSVDNSRVDDETGFQFFAAYDLTMVNLMEGVSTSVELGYMDYGFDGRDSDGIWSTVVVGGKISGNFGWLGRLGLDFGDDSGLMFGAGVDYTIHQNLDIRGEYVIRDDIDSLQVNLLFRL